MNKITIAVFFILLIAGIAVLYLYIGELSSEGGCNPLGGKLYKKSYIKAEEYGAITRYNLPSPLRAPNAITVDKDGSVWFGEWTVPGIGHLFRNGTLVEYAIPVKRSITTSTTCEYQMTIWGIAIWNRRVMVADMDGNRIFSLDPSKASFRTINLSTPYELEVSEDNSLWVTILSSPGRIARIFPNDTLVLYQVEGVGNLIPVEIAFINETKAYFVALDPFSSKGNIFSFNPSKIVNGRINAEVVQASFNLISPTSISFSNDVLWVTQHGASSLASYNLTSKEWSVYPTSIENFTYTTLPYFVRANGSLIWFNEHYTNKLAVIDTDNGILTEYQESSRQVNNLSTIDNVLTFATAKDVVWFSAVTGNYIGLVDASNKPSFSISTSDRSIDIKPGTSVSIKLEVNGTNKEKLSVRVSDSENFTSRPEFLRITPSIKDLELQGSSVTFDVTIQALKGIKAGDYTVAITVTDGHIFRSVYIFVHVST